MFTHRPPALYECPNPMNPTVCHWKYDDGANSFKVGHDYFMLLFSNASNGILHSSRAQIETKYKGRTTPREEGQFFAQV